MQDIKDGVGDGGRNDVHDVALVQAILRVVKTKAGAPYLSGNYDGIYGPTTKEAIIKFQANQLLIGPVPSPEKMGFVDKESVTFQKMVASLPESYKSMRIIQETKTVYLEDTPERAREARAKLAHYGLQPTFRQKVGSLIAPITEPKPWLEELKAASPASVEPFWKTMQIGISGSR